MWIPWAKGDSYPGWYGVGLCEISSLYSEWHATENLLIVIYENFHLVFSDRRLPLVTRTSESETEDKGGLFSFMTSGYSYLIDQDYSIISPTFLLLFSFFHCSSFKYLIHLELLIFVYLRKGSPQIIPMQKEILTY